MPATRMSIDCVRHLLTLEANDDFRKGVNGLVHVDPLPVPASSSELRSLVNRSNPGQKTSILLDWVRSVSLLSAMIDKSEPTRDIWLFQVDDVSWRLG